MIPGWIVSIVTFPGVIVHEMAHQFACRLSRVAVLDVCYFRFGNPVGYVIHEKPISVYQNLIIGIGPFIFNTVLGALIAAPGAIPVLEFESAQPIDYFLIWLGVSIAMHSFPSTGDANSIWHSLWSEKSSLLAKIIGSPLVVIIYLGAFGSIIWLDLFYGLAVAMLIPNMLIYMFA
jgi:hypothetical protein